ncbi:MAG: hypothetical protein K0Q79_1240 [Flavipsychrobacter sp.]|jgi:hypothetical protein|nr:hypothetical protein [Flavipsychrobacter sp.]
MKLFVNILLLTCVAFNSPAQNEGRWAAYMTIMDGKPASVLVDLNLASKAPLSQYPNLVITGPMVQTCKNDGLPDTAEIEALEEVLTATSNFIAGVTAKVNAGTFTHKCQRLNYYYVKDTTGIRNAIARMYKRSFSNYSYAIKIKPDREWDTYFKVLFPDELTQNRMVNDDIIWKMMERGDSLNVMRDIHFKLFFASDTARTNFIKGVADKGYKQLKLNQSKKPPVAYGVVLQKQVLLRPEDINAATEELIKEARKHNGEFEGWTTPNR